MRNPFFTLLAVAVTLAVGGCGSEEPGSADLDDARDVGRDFSGLGPGCPDGRPVNTCGGCGSLSAAVGQPCQLGELQPEWACPVAIWICDGESEVICAWVTPSDEVCDGVDNDCDTLVDEDFDLPNNPDNCGECGRVCAVQNGIRECVEGECGVFACEAGWVDLDGQVGNGCEAECLPDGSLIDDCDGVDNDCDGFTDEDFAVTACGIGACATESACVDGLARACQPLEPAAADETRCDGVDEDCDGEVDEAITSPCRNACGEGALTCQNGELPACTATAETGDVCIDIQFFCQTIPIELELPLPTPEEGLGVDVAFVFDRSGSFSDDLTTFRQKATDLTTALSAELANLQVGLASFVDAPCSGFGGSSDFGYEPNLALTDDLAALGAAFEGIDIRSGVDIAESQIEAMYQAITGEGVRVSGVPACDGVADIAPSDLGWRDLGLGYLFLSTDAVFHRPTDAGYPYPHDADDVIAAANAAGIFVYFLQAGGAADPDANRIAAATGGAVFTLSSDSAEIVSTVTDAIFNALSNAELELVAEGDELGFVTDVTPRFIRGVDLLTNSRLNARVTLLSTLDPSGEEQTYDFDLVFYVNGAEVDRRPVSVTIPAEDPKDCSNRPPIIRSLEVPPSIPAGSAIVLSVQADEPDGQPMTYEWTASAGTLGEPTGSASSFTAPPPPGLVDIEVVVTDVDGATDVATATTMVTAGSCSTEPALLELGLTEGRMVLRGELDQYRASGTCGGGGAEAVIHLRVHDRREYRFSIDTPGDWVLHLRGPDCAWELTCSNSSISTAFEPGDYLLFVDSASANIGTGFKLYAQPQ